MSSDKIPNKIRDIQGRVDTVRDYSAKIYKEDILYLLQLIEVRDLQIKMLKERLSVKLNLTAGPDGEISGRI